MIIDNVLRFLILIILWTSVNKVVFAGFQKQVDSVQDSQLIIDINELTYTIANNHDQFHSFIGVRALSLVHLSIHDILNSKENKYATYLFSGACSDDVDVNIAIIFSSRIILKNIYPDYADTIDQVCEEWLFSCKKDETQKSQYFGEKIASLLLKSRAQDGHQNNGEYTPMTKPGDYQFTPGFDYVWKPDFSLAQPFTLDSVNQFRAEEPPVMSQQEYASSFHEVKKYGCKKSSLRSNDQTSIGHWWAEFGEHSWNRIGRIVARSNQLTAIDANRMFALLNMNLYDLYLVSFESKYYYDTWRPITAIHHADSDGNDKTIADTSWTPEMITPPWPEYPSAHAAVGAAGAEIISHVLGTSKVYFAMHSTTALPKYPIRNYYDLDIAAKDCAQSRIYNGFHFRFATDAGLMQGRAIAKHTINNYLANLD